MLRLSFVGGRGDGNSDLDDVIRERARRFKRGHATFYSNVLLALSVGLWVALFSLPVYCSPVHWFIFGHRGALAGLDEEHKLAEEQANQTTKRTVPILECGEDKMGRQRNIAAYPDAPILVSWNNRMAPWRSPEGTDIWCGILPSKFESYWSNIAQMIIFTVFQNTGTTVNLAWQGAVGTWCACLNMMLMTTLYPSGALGHICSDAEDLAGECEEGALVNPAPIDANYSPAVAWLDTLVVLFLFLISRSNANTIKFGMSWHVFFMMNFMNPAYGVKRGVFPMWGDLDFDDEVSLVRYTSYAGALLAIMATFVPRPLLNIKVLFKSSTDVTDAICDIWRNTVDYMCGNHRTLRRIYIEKSIDLLDTKVSKLNGMISGSWWETCGGIGRCGRRWELIQAYSSNAVDFQDILFAVQSCAGKAKFSRRQITFYEALKSPMEKLCQATSDLLHLCLESCKDGSIDDDEKEEIQEGIESVRSESIMLLDAYAGMVSEQGVPAPGLSESSDHVLMVALMSWSRGIRSLAEQILDVCDEESESSWFHPCRQLLRNLVKGLNETWSPQKIFLGVRGSDSFPFLVLNEHLKFTFRNFVPISICFVLGYHTLSVGSGYSSTMASTLALLITPYAGGAFQNNLQRLLGVSLGKTIPILLYLLLNFWPSYSFGRELFQGLMIWIFVSCFCYVYYTSIQWSQVGCLVAGFGVVPLLSTSASYDEATLAKRYTEIGQVTFAIFIQLASDFFLRRSGPREVAVLRLQELCDALGPTYRGFFDGDAEGVAANFAIAADKLQALQGVAPQTDPRLQLAPGPASQFKTQLLKDALPKLQLLLSDLSLLVSALQSHYREDKEAMDKTLQQMHSALVSRPAMEGVRQHFEGMLEETMEMLTRVLANTEEEPVDLQGLVSVARSDLLDPQQLVSELSASSFLSDAGGDPRLATELRLRMNAIAEVLCSSTEHLQSLQILCIRENMQL